MIKLKVTAISDTHKARPANIPNGDVLLFCGDDDIRSYVELEDFVAYFASFPHKYKLWIAGNHDFYCEQYPDDVWDMCGRWGIYYMHNTTCVIAGVKFWGSPVTPEFGKWAFMLPRGEEIEEVWKLIPKDTDVLVTHGPALGYLDQTCRGNIVGCYGLGRAIEKIQPQYHVFGHIHECGGKMKAMSATTFINASICNEDYDCVNPAMTFQVRSQS